MDMHRFTQDNRLIAVSDFGLGKDTFLLAEFEAKEKISELFHFNLKVLSKNLDINPDDIVGKSVTVTLNQSEARYFHGFVSEFVYGEVKGDELREYSLVVVPWLWFLSQTNNHRIFQNKSTKDIVSQILTERGFSDFSFTAEGGSPREYCIQHNESDLHFISRLLEEEGITYYFTHEQNRHVLMIVDDPAAFEPCSESQAIYSHGSTPECQISKWEHGYKFKKGRWTIRDYNFKQPTNTVMGSTQTLSHFSNNGGFEHYVYPGLYDGRSGDSAVKVRLDSEEFDRNQVHGTSNYSSFRAGGRFELTEHTTRQEKGDYVLVEVCHLAKEPSYLHGTEDVSEYQNEFICVPHEIQIRPALRHERPIMRGPQNAVVVGPAGEEIFVDDFGRIKVQFIWDREGSFDQNSTCFIRLMQSWAGNKWGASFVPRIGHEVIVDFIDGDPDRPIVTGSVYNGKNKPPYASKTQSGIKSRSTKGASASNYNEIRFDDKLGAEQLYVQAEKNQDNLVKNDETTQVGNNRTENVGNDETITIGNNRTENVGVDETISIGSNRSETVGSNENISIGSNRTENVGADESVSVGSNQTISVGSNQTFSVGSNRKKNIGSNETASVGKMRTHSIGINDMLNVGAAQEISVGGFRMVNVGLYQNRNTGLSLIEKVGKSITIDAGDEITIKTGESSLNMKSDGTITLKGKDISIVGSGEISAKATDNMTLKAKKILEN